MARICIFGDSITWGAFDKEHGGWVSRLRKDIEKSDNNTRIYNCGISGDNTEDLLQRFKTESIARKAEVIIFAIGINDSQYIKSKENPCVDLKKFQENLKELLKQAKELTEKIIFIGLTDIDESEIVPPTWEPSLTYDKENVSIYNSKIKEFCTKNKLFFIEMTNLLSNKDLEDGLHPTSLGHQKMFEKIKGFLIENHII